MTEDREIYVRENAVALVEERDAKIARLRKELARRNRSVAGLKKENRRLRAENDLHREGLTEEALEHTNHGSDTTADLLREVAERGRTHGGVFGGPKQEAAAKAILKLRDEAVRVSSLAATLAEFLRRQGYDDRHLAVHGYREVLSVLAELAREALEE